MYINEVVYTQGLKKYVLKKKHEDMQSHTLMLSILHAVVTYDNTKTNNAVLWSSTMELGRQLGGEVPMGVVFRPAQRQPIDPHHYGHSSLVALVEMLIISNCAM